MPTKLPTTETFANPIWATEGWDNGAIYQPGPGRHRHRRDLRLYGARGCHDLSGDRPSELRPGRNGDVFHLHLLAIDTVGRALLGRLPGHAGVFVRLRHPDRAIAVQAAGQGTGADL